MVGSDLFPLDWSFVLNTLLYCNESRCINVSTRDYCLAVYCEESRSRTDTLHHMVHPVKWIKINVFQKLHSCCLVHTHYWEWWGWGGGGWEVRVESARPPTTPPSPSPLHPSGTGRCLHIIRFLLQSISETGLKARLLDFYLIFLPLNQTFTTCSCKSIRYHHAYLCVYSLWAIKKAGSFPLSSYSTSGHLTISTT